MGKKRDALRISSRHSSNYGGSLESLGNVLRCEMIHGDVAATRQPVSRAFSAEGYEVVGGYMSWDRRREWCGSGSETLSKHKNRHKHHKHHKLEFELN